MKPRVETTLIDDLDTYMPRIPLFSMHLTIFDLMQETELLMQSNLALLCLAEVMDYPHSHMRSFDHLLLNVVKISKTVEVDIQSVKF